MSSTVKIILSVMIVLGGGYIGVFMASAFSVRVKQINQFKSVITQMGFNIGFLKMTVADAMKEASKVGKGAVKDIFSYSAEIIKDKGAAPSTALERGFLKYRDYICLTNEDRAIVMEFAQKLGTGDSECEENNIKAVVAKLTLSGEEAEIKRQRQGRLWKGLGFLGGMLLAIILF